MQLPSFTCRHRGENYGAEYTLSSLPVRSTCNSSSPFKNSPLVNIMHIALSAESTAASSWRRQAGVGACVVVSRVFTGGETALGLLGYSCYVKLLDEISRALHAVCTVIYTTEGWCKRPLTQNKCFTPTLSQWLRREQGSREQRLGQAGSTGWGCGSSLALPASCLALRQRLLVLVPVQRRCSGSALARTSVHEVLVVKQLSPRECLAPLDHNGYSHVTPALRKHSAVTCSPLVGQDWT